MFYEKNFDCSVPEGQSVEDTNFDKIGNSTIEKLPPFFMTDWIFCTQGIDPKIQIRVRLLGQLHSMMYFLNWTIQKMGQGMSCGPSTCSG